MKTAISRPARYDASFVDLTSVHVLLASLLFVSR